MTEAQSVGYSIRTSSAREALAQVVSVDGLRVETATGLPIVDNVSFDLREGEILGVVGESGSGKTTTALSVFGFAQGGARFAQGRVTIPGRPGIDLATSRTLRDLRGRYFSYVPQSPGTALNPSMRIGRLLKEVSDRRAAADPAFRQRVAAETADVLKTVDLPAGEEFRRRFPHQLSGGQQQRVCIAMALLSGSKAIVLDEPTTGLDVITQAAVIGELRRLREERGVSMVYISHDLAVVAELATRVAVMYAGEIVEVGDAHDVLTNPSHPYTRGLLQARPDFKRNGAITPMKGVAVGLGHRPPSCSFAPRCSRATEECRTQRPPVVPTTSGAEASVRCFHPVHEPLVLTERADSGQGRSEAGSVLSVQDLNITHRVRGVATASIREINFELGRGQCLALVGESGSGKSTIARAVAGLQAVDSGAIHLAGEPLPVKGARRSADQHRRLQIVFQNATAALNPRESIGTAIDRARRSAFKTRAADVPTVEDLLDLVRLPRSVVDRLPRELSGGERQRVCIARALATRPDVIVCDEITSALDVSVQAAVLALLNDLRRELGVALLFITHDIGVVAGLADAVMVLDKGRICETGPTAQVLRTPSSDYARKLMDAVPTVAAG